MKVISITGGVGSGKSEVLKILMEDYGADIIAADQVAKELTEPGTEGFRRMAELAGPGILRDDGSIDRKKMADILFKDGKMVERVNAAVHPLVWAEIKKRIASSGKMLVIVEAALYDEEHNAMFDEIWYIRASEEKRIERLMKSRGYTEEKCLEIMANQASDRDFMSFAHRIIKNDGEQQELSKQISGLLKEE